MLGMEAHIDRFCISMIIRAVVISLVLALGMVTNVDASPCIAMCLSSPPSQFIQRKTRTLPTSREVTGKMIRSLLAAPMLPRPGTPTEGVGGRGGVIHPPERVDVSGGKSGISKARRLAKEP